jgi:lipoprotein-anchoring transpeptidase ErfK/SrfK
VRPRVVALLALALAVAGCGGEHGAQDSADRLPPAERLERAPASPPAEAGLLEAGPVAAPTCAPGEARDLRSNRRAFAAVAKRTTLAHRKPGGAKLAEFGPFNANGVPTVFGVLEAVVDRRCEPQWYHVQLPLRPNGITGYVPASAVELVRVRTRIVVDLSKRRVTFFRDGDMLIRTPTAVGSPVTPTPTGSFYVNQRLRPTVRWGPFGPAALGISAFSAVLQNWTQGGPIAIHGTNQPSSIGEAASHGCLRVDNHVLERLFRLTPAGTPVLIRV